MNTRNDKFWNGATSAGLPRRAVVCGLLAGLLALLGVAPLSAQRNQLPQLGYFAGFGEYYRADYKDAERFFRRGDNTAFKFGNRRFLDSVCYWTMVGECYYHMGNYAQAIAMYEQSLKLYLDYQGDNWQARVKLPPSIQADNTAVAQAQINWGTSTRSARIARLPPTYQVLFGRMDAERALQEGGVVQNPEFKSVDLNEIMRCLALCLHRRRVIKGPTCQYDPLSHQLVTGLSQGAGGGSVLGAYNGVLLGIAYAGTEDWDKATSALKRSLQLSGGLDHGLTPVALLELAHIGSETGNDEVAGRLALEASYSAAVFGQFDLVSEALALGSTLHLKVSKSAYPPLQNAIGWANSNGARLMQAEMVVRLAECLSESGDAAGSEKVLRAAGKAIRSTNSLGNAVVSGRLKYVQALNQFLTANFDRGMTALGGALQHYQTGSLWLYRLGLANQLTVGGGINSRQADQLYGVLLRDPTEQDWKTDPLEALAYLASPHVEAMERWFDIVVARRDYQRALHIAELVRRHRFFSSLPMGGRLMSFRWVMQAPEEAVSDAALVQRSEFLNRNAAYKQVADQGRQLLESLQQLPIFPETGSDDAIAQARMVKQLSQASLTQEALLASHALRREPSEAAFPPSVALAELQSAIRPDQFALVTLQTLSGYHFFFVGQQSVQYVNTSDPRVVERAVAKWLSELGVNQVTLEMNKLESTEWKVQGREMLSQLFPNTTPVDWEKFSELVVIPDGILWLVPFEALVVGEGEDEWLLSERIHVRYSPTLALAFGAQRPERKISRTAVIPGRLFARGETELVDAQIEELKKQIPDAERMDRIRLNSNDLGALVDQLIVWDDIPPTRGKPFALAPMQLNSAQQNGTLAAWMTLPWQGPQHLIMPGYHSEGVLLRGRGYGGDLFLTSMALMASGNRTTLISRWNSGGKTALELTRAYAEKMDAEGIPKALAEARRKVRESDIDFANEPRLKPVKGQAATKAAHPYFWASSMLLAVPDTREPGVVPRIAPESSDDADPVPGDDKDGDDKGGDDQGGDDNDGDDNDGDDKDGGDNADDGQTDDDKNGDDQGRTMTGKAMTRPGDDREGGDMQIVDSTRGVYRGAYGGV